MRTLVLFFTLAVGLSLAACSASRTRSFNWQTDADLNKNSQGTSTALTLHIFQLASRGKFDEADYNSLVTDPTGTLGDTLIGEIQKGPIIYHSRDAATTIEIHDLDKVKFIGVMGMFNKPPEVGQWKVCTSVDELGDKTLYFKDFTITLK